MNEFEALVRSLGESLVGYIGRENLSRLTIRVDPDSLSAFVVVQLESETFESVMHAIERIGEVRLMFMDDLSFDYVLAADEGTELGASATPQNELVFA